MDIFAQLDSAVHGYGRQFPVVWQRAHASYLYEEGGNRYLDFLCAAASLNYGHNHPVLKRALIEYLISDGVVQALDMYSAARRDFLETFQRRILNPRRMLYRLQFAGPSGADAVEAALKIARRATRRQLVLAFTNAFHGVTLGALAVTASRYHSDVAGVPPLGTRFLPYDGYLGPRVDTTTYLDKLMSDPSSGLPPPAAVIFESVQAEGGLTAARPDWLRNLHNVCRKHGALLIADETQTGCGRTGAFFGFEEAAIEPDIIVLSNALSGYGLPLSMVLLKPALDRWQPSEHQDPFAANVPALVAAGAALRHFWSDDSFVVDVRRKSTYLHERLDMIVRLYGEGRLGVRGRGMMAGLDCRVASLAQGIAEQAFERGLLLTCCGADGRVVKCMPPLTASDQELTEGLNIIEACVAECSEGHWKTLDDG